MTADEAAREWLAGAMETHSKDDADVLFIMDLATLLRARERAAWIAGRDAANDYLRHRSIRLSHVGTDLNATMDEIEALKPPEKM